MRIFYDGNAFEWQQYGGVTRYFFELITRISKMDDAEVEVYHGFHINNYGLENHKSQFSAYYGHKMPYIKRTGFIRRFLSRRAAKRFAAKLPKGDTRIQHLSYLTFFDIGPSKKIFTIHDLINEKYPQYYPAHDQVLEHRRSALTCADGIICISEATKRDMLYYYGDIIDPRCKITTIPHGYIGLDDMSSSGARLPEKPYFLYVGERGKYKNFTTLLKAYASSETLNKDHLIACMGGGPFTHAENELISSLSIGGKVVQYFGKDEVLADLYKNAAAFIYPSRYEGFGIPPLEAMSCSCPVIASNSSSIPEVTGSAAILFDPDSVDELRTAMTDISENERLRDELIRKGHERCRHFSWDKTAEMTMRFYHECLE